jgi:hypothetical protein
MDYTKHYTLLVERARHRTLTGYMEKHHILPRCMGGTDDPENLVELTPEEHYVAHQLLMKMYPEESGLVFAAIMMTAQRPSNKLYGWVKRRMSLLASSKRGLSHQCHGRKWITDGKKNRTIPPTAHLPRGWSFGRTEHFQKHKPTDEVKAKIAAGNRGKKMSAEAKAKIAAARRGKKHSAETIAKIAASHRKVVVPEGIEPS